jgi:hypothetical protein
VPRAFESFESNKNSFNKHISSFDDLPKDSKARDKFDSWQQQPKQLDGSSPRFGS